jgi:ribosomal protein L31
VLTAQTASFVANAQSASNAVTAQTASYANTFTVGSTLTAQTLVVQTITSSVDFVTGSTRFGSTGSNTHQFTGSVGVEGTGIFYQPLTNSTSYLTVQNNRARNAAVYTVTTNGGFYAGTSIGTDTFNYQIYDGVAGVSRITVDSAGNIGMGTSNPVSTLPTGSSVLINNGWTVNSSIIASRKVLEINSNDNNGGNVGLFLRQLNKSVGLDIWSDNYYGNAYIDSRFDNSASYISFRLRTANQANIVNAMVIKADGYVGIGTTNPSQLLEVVGGEIKAGRVDSSNEGGQVSFGRSTDNATAWYIDAYGNTASPQLRFVDVTGAAVRMTITGSNVGIGTTSPSGLLQVGVANSGIYIDTTTQYTPKIIAAGTISDIQIQSVGNGGNVYLNAPGATSLITMSTNGAERMRIGSTASQWDLMIGTTSVLQPSTGRASVSINGSTNSIVSFGVGGALKGYIYHGGTQMYIENSISGGALNVNSGGAGGVLLNSGATSWVSASDIRLKNINSNIENAIDKLLTLRAINFSWKSDSTNKEVLGLIAQEVEVVFPQVVDTNKLPNSPSNPSEDEIEYLGIRYTEMIPVLVKAIQELTARVQYLENK